MFPNFMKILTKLKMYEFIPSRSVSFFKEFIEDTINRRRNKQQVIDFY